jgi:small-conductance mechanosensitive channel/CRP-like cAMP-binding protein
MDELDLGWLLGVGVGIAGTLLGFLALRWLLRRQAAWSGSVAAPLLLFGPAVGLLLGSVLGGGPLWFGPGAERAPVNAAWSILAFFGATAVFGVARAFLQSHLVKEELGIRIPGLVLDAARWLLWLVMVFVVVGVIWGKTDWFTPLFTASAIGTVILGLALQETLANFIAGISLVTEGIYGIGDWVFIGDDEGEVLQITRRTTKLRTRTNDVLTIANRGIVSARVRNQSRATPAHAEFVHVFAPLDAAPNRVRQALREAVREVPGVLEDPAPIYRLLRFGDHGAEYQVKIFLTDVARVPDVKSDALVQIWYHLARAGIEIPYPVRELARLPSAPRADREETARAVRARLHALPLFQTLPDEVLEGLVRDARVHVFGAGERVVQKGQGGDSCFVIDSGSVEVLAGDGAATTRVATLREGDLFGEMSLLTGEPRSATVRTLGDARLISVGAESLRDALQKSPDLAQRLAETATARREGLGSALSAADAATRARVEAGSTRLRTLIRRFFQV